MGENYQSFIVELAQQRNQNSCSYMGIPVAYVV